MTDGYEIKLDVFQGPLDLLLYLIRKNEIDIYNIPIALVTEQYLQHLAMMRSLNLDLAGEYLVLAATLIHIKSKTLLPPEEQEGEEPEEEDPRAELVRQLLEYQSFKEAAMQLGGREILERDVFKGTHAAEPIEVAGDEEIVEVDIFALVEAFRKVATTMGRPDLMEIDVEKISLADRINEIMDRLTQAGNLAFTELFEQSADRRRILYTFLAILELMKLRLIRAFQSRSFGVIRIFLAVESTDERDQTDS